MLVQFYFTKKTECVIVSVKPYWSIVILQIFSILSTSSGILLLFIYLKTTRILLLIRAHIYRINKAFGPLNSLKFRIKFPKNSD
jgi:hypothetical protein